MGSTRRMGIMNKTKDFLEKLLPAFVGLLGFYFGSKKGRAYLSLW
jgi:hypothetical protein